MSLTVTRRSPEQIARAELQAELDRHLILAQRELARIESCCQPGQETAELATPDLLEILATHIMVHSLNVQLDQAPRMQADLCRSSADAAWTALDALAAALRHRAKLGRRNRPRVDWESVERLLWLEANDAVQHAADRLAAWVAKCRKREGPDV